MGRKKSKPVENGVPPVKTDPQSQWDIEVVCSWAAHVKELSDKRDRAYIRAVEARDALRAARAFLKDCEGLLQTALGQPPGTFPLFERRPAEDVRERMEAAAREAEAIASCYTFGVQHMYDLGDEIIAALQEAGYHTLGDILDASQHMNADTLDKRLYWFLTTLESDLGEHIDRAANHLRNYVAIKVNLLGVAEAHWCRVDGKAERQEAHA